MSVQLSQEKFSYILEVLTAQCNNGDFCTVGEDEICPFNAKPCSKVTEDDWYDFLMKNEEDGEGGE